MNVLCLYNSTQTYTNTVYEHLNSFSLHSKFNWFYAHCDRENNIQLNFNNFNAICIHYSVRLPFEQINPLFIDALIEFKGLKFLFIQDEYDNTKVAWSYISKIRFNIVFSVVPRDNLSQVYPKKYFPDTRFYSVLTGYCPEESIPYTLPSERTIAISYRGRKLPLKYGALGQQKWKIGKLFKDYCDKNSIPNDISWDDKSRIYGAGWLEFLVSSRAMLGTESGSNVFDWDGDLQYKIESYKKTNPFANNNDVYDNVIKRLEVPGLMNQISPRIFEMIAAHTVLVLLEGTYSGIIKPYVHYLPVKIDGSNLDEIFKFISDDTLVNDITKRAYSDIIESEKYNYRSFVSFVDSCIMSEFEKFDSINAAAANDGKYLTSNISQNNWITTYPIRAKQGQIQLPLFCFSDGYIKLNISVIKAFNLMPNFIQVIIKRAVKYLKLKVG